MIAGENGLKKLMAILNLKGNDSCEVKVNDLFIMETPGGGGYGKN